MYWTCAQLSDLGSRSPSAAEHLPKDCPTAILWYSMEVDAVFGGEDDGGKSYKSMFYDREGERYNGTKLKQKLFDSRLVFSHRGDS